MLQRVMKHQQQKNEWVREIGRRTNTKSARHDNTDTELDTDKVDSTNAENKENQGGAEMKSKIEGRDNIDKGILQERLMLDQQWT